MKSCEPMLIAPILAMAEHQEEYLTIRAARVHMPGYPSRPGTANTHVVAFEPSPEERARIAAGENIYVSLLTFGGPMTPLLVSCGAEETAAIFDVRVRTP